jgi:hypothetical protein
VTTYSTLVEHGTEKVSPHCCPKRWFKPRLLNSSLGLRIPSDRGNPYRLTAYGDAVSRSLKSAGGLLSKSAGTFIPVSDRGVFRRPGRLRDVELAVALFDAASPLVPGNDDTDMVRASPLACSGDFLLRLAVRQGKHLITEGRGTALATS